MNRAELRAQLRTDLHRAQYLDADLNNYISRGEGYIKANLRAYPLTYNFTDADRVVVGGAEYTLPGSVVKERVLVCNGAVLDKRDETTIYYYASSGVVSMYAMRPTTIVFAGTPGLLTTIAFQYLGIPPALPEASSNSLADDYPQLYFHCAAIYLFQRAADPDASAFHENAADKLLKKINKKFKNLIGSGEAAPVYNTAFRSSY